MGVGAALLVGQLSHGQSSKPDELCPSAMLCTSHALDLFDWKISKAVPSTSVIPRTVLIRSICILMGEGQTLRHSVTEETLLVVEAAHQRWSAP